jgi:hypothetical protein
MSDLKHLSENSWSGSNFNNNNAAGIAFAMAASDDLGNSLNKNMDQVRSDFRETWIWTTMNVR